MWLIAWGGSGGTEGDNSSCMLIWLIVSSSHLMGLLSCQMYFGPGSSSAAVQNVQPSSQGVVQEPMAIEASIRFVMT